MYDPERNPYCRFSTLDGKKIRHFVLNPDGSIHDLGHAGHDNERHWKYSAGTLILLSSKMEATASFQFKKQDGDFITLEGLHKEKIPLKIIATDSRTKLFQTRTAHLHQADIRAGIIKVGHHTYGSLELIDKQFGRLEIGDYCSIAPGTRFVLGNHRVDLVTTYPFKTLRAFWPVPDACAHDHDSAGVTTIGNDVWFGSGVIVMSGVHVGDGAVIAAHAVVTKDVAPYSIVGGNPARHLRYRIEDASARKSMQEIAWWNWSEERVAGNTRHLLSGDIHRFIEQFQASAHSADGA